MKNLSYKGTFSCQRSTGVPPDRSICSIFVHRNKTDSAPAALEVATGGPAFCPKEHDHLCADVRRGGESARMQRSPIAGIAVAP
jgi:hypothetical protein